MTIIYVDADIRVIPPVNPAHFGRARARDPWRQGWWPDRHAAQPGAMAASRDPPDRLPRSYFTAA